MYAFKVVTTVFLALMIVISGYIVAKAEDRSSVYVGIGISVIQMLAIAAIWM